MFLIIKNMFKIKIHVFFYIMMFVALFTGNIIDYLIFMCIIFVHELGHVFGGFIFSWRIKKIIILPFGGLTIFDNLINTSLFQQFIVTLLGPLFQVCFYFLISCFFNMPSSVVYYSFVLLFFNLLPIFPLDGSKFLYVFLCLIFPFKYSHLILIFVSFLFIVLVLLFIGHFDLLIYLVLLFLLFKCISEFKNHSVIFNKFLFERYSNNLYFKHVRYVSCSNMMYLWCRHLFDVNGIYVTERNYIGKMFDNDYKL